MSKHHKPARPAPPRSSQNHTPQVPEVISQRGVFALPAPAELHRVMTENLEGLEPSFSIIKVPSGGGLAFEIPGDKEEPEIAREIEGIVLDHYRARAYWPDRYSGDKTQPPACSSLDGITGEGEPGGACISCPHNQWGTGKNERGKACKEMHRLFVLTQGNLFPYLIAAPPTSIKNVAIFATKLAGRMRSLSSVITKIKLVKDKNKEGIEYSKLEFFTAGDLDPETALKVTTLAKSLKPAMRKRPIEEAEYKEAGGDAADNY